MCFSFFFSRADMSVGTSEVRVNDTMQNALEPMSQRDEPLSHVLRN